MSPKGRPPVPQKKKKENRGGGGVVEMSTIKSDFSEQNLFTWNPSSGAEVWKLGMAVKDL